CLNMVLDPIFIYQLDMGIAGAAWATVISYLSSCIMAHYWLVAKRQSYADIDLRQRSISKDVSLDIFKVGIPASFQTVSFSVYMFLLNGIVLSVGGTDGVAILSTGWRVTNMATLPLIGMAMGVSTVTGATFGAKQYGKLKETYLYSLRLGIVFESLIALAVYLLAPYIAMLFTQGDGAARIYEGLVTFLRVVCIYLPVASLSMFSSSFFNGIGKGINGLSVTLLRTVIFTVPAAYMLGIVMDYGLLGIWSSIVVANLLSGMLSFLWARSIIGKMESQWLGIA
ncbi:MAG TPA: MATE family efflux transporter, partial [Candidatus Methanofastidiosa archaeon]|nr:MATE family efflux transporter [Candidatus Methanofastidiosa archaeon]